MKALLTILAVAFILAELRTRGQITAASTMGTTPAPANVPEIPYGGGTGEQLYPSDPWTPTGPGAQIPVSIKGGTVGGGPNLASWWRLRRAP